MANCVECGKTLLGVQKDFCSTCKNKNLDHKIKHIELREEIPPNPSFSENAKKYFEGALIKYGSGFIIIFLLIWLFGV
ncbi:MAG: hypothetical protein INQ03_19085 [Candidatus Heimdallarchaeota archaeon]|nr:hypothetical protein [Candidatus Heimdallarchaeota archaeon]